MLLNAVKTHIVHNTMQNQGLQELLSLFNYKFQFKIV